MADMSARKTSQNSPKDQLNSDRKSGRSGGESKRSARSARQSGQDAQDVKSQDSKQLKKHGTTHDPEAGGSPRSSGSGHSEGAAHKHHKHKRSCRDRLHCPKCKCCMWLCPCMFCCHPDALLDKATLVADMQSFAKGKKGQINMALVEDQLRQDRENMAEHKRKWRRRWIGCCCCSCCSILIAVTVAVVVLATNDWTLITRQASWSPRIHFGAVFTDARHLYVAGGTDMSNNLADVWMSSDKGESWSRLVDTASFGTRHGHAMLDIRGELLIIGGDGGSTSSSTAPVPLQDVWKSANGRDWTLVTSSAPWPPRKRFGATVDGAGTIYIIGGIDIMGRSGLNDMWRSTDRGSTWTPVSLASPWSARHSFGFVRLPGGTRQGRLLILGGSDGRAQHDVWASDDVGQSWHRMLFSHIREMVYRDDANVASWTPRYSMGVVSDKGGKITMCGGGTDGTSNHAFSREVWELESPPSETVPWYFKKTTDHRLNVDRYPRQWKKLGEPLWTPRRYLFSFSDENDIVYILGGQETFDSSGMKNDIWKKETSLDLQNLKDAYKSATSRASGAPPQGDPGLSATPSPTPSNNAQQR